MTRRATTARGRSAGRTGAGPPGQPRAPDDRAQPLPAGEQDAVLPLGVDPSVLDGHPVPGQLVVEPVAVELRREPDVDRSAAPDRELEVEAGQPHALVAERVEVPLDHPGALDEVRARPVLLDREVGAEPAVHVGQVVEPELGEGAVPGRVVVAGVEDLGRLQQVGGEQEPVARGRGSRRCRPAAPGAPPVSRCRCCCPGRPRPDARRRARCAAGPAPARSGPTARPPPAPARRRSGCARSCSSISRLTSTGR